MLQTNQTKYYKILILVDIENFKSLINFIRRRLISEIGPIKKAKAEQLKELNIYL